MYFYSPSTNGFFHSLVHGPRQIMGPDPSFVPPADAPDALAPMVLVKNEESRIPEDAVEVSEERHAEIVAAIAAGHAIGAGPDGAPVILPVPNYWDGFTPEQLQADFDSQRARAIQATQWMVDRHRDEVDADGSTTLSVARYKALQAYRQAVRDMEMSYPLQFPKNPEA